MAFRKVGVTEIREVLRSWLAGARLRKVARQAGLDHEADRRYVEAADARDGGAGQLPDELVGQVAGPHRFRRPAAAGTRSGNDPTTRQRCLSSPPAKSDLASCKPVARALGQLRDGSWVLPVPNDAPLPRTSTRTARSWHRSACSGLR
jgi:hypothetical protein